MAFSNKLIELQRNIRCLSQNLQVVVSTRKYSGANVRDGHRSCRLNRLSTSGILQQELPKNLSSASVSFTSPGISDNPHSAQLKLCLGAEADYFEFDPSSSANQDWKSRVLNTMLIYPSFISPEEEESIMKEIEPYMSRLHYESSHWDDAISDYRETERSKWTKKNQLTIDRIRATAFPSNVPQLKLVHVLDLAQKGHIKPHIDSVRFCGNTIAGLSLLSDCVMRIRHETQKEFFCDIFLPQYSLYVMSDFVRYEFTHEILGEIDSKFKGNPVARKRRISIVCRNEPPAEESATSGPVFIPIPSTS